MLLAAPAPAHPPAHHAGGAHGGGHGGHAWDPSERQHNPEPRDAPRWPPGRYNADLGFYGAGEYGPGGWGPGGLWYGPGELAGFPPTWNYDGPTAAIMRRNTRERGPWERVGALIDANASAHHDKDAAALPLFARQNGRSGNDRFDYRTVKDKVPIEITQEDRGINWISNGDAVTVPGLGRFTAQVYADFR